MKGVFDGEEDIPKPESFFYKDDDHIGSSDEDAAEELIQPVVQRKNLIEEKLNSIISDLSVLEKQFKDETVKVRQSQDAKIKLQSLQEIPEIAELMAKIRKLRSHKEKLELALKDDDGEDKNKKKK